MGVRALGYRPAEGPAGAVLSRTILGQEAPVDLLDVDAACTASTPLAISIKLPRSGCVWCLMAEKSSGRLSPADGAGRATGGARRHCLGAAV